MYIHKISYNKVMLDGNLKGMSLPSSYKLPSTVSADHNVKQLASITKDNPIKDVSGNRFYVENIIVVQL